MNQQITKEQLIERFMTIDVLNKLEMDNDIATLEAYLTDKPDMDLTLKLCVLKTRKADNNQQSFEACCKEAAPVFAHLETIENFEYMDLYILSFVIGYHPDYCKTLEMMSKAMKILSSETYFNNSDYRKIRCAMNYNLTLRLLRAKYLEPNVDEDALNAAFKSCYKQVEEIVLNRSLPQSQIIKVRKGVFENDTSLIQEGLYMLRKSNNKKIFRAARDEIAKYLKFQKHRFGAGLTNFFTGCQIVARREELGLTIELVARVLDVPISTIEDIEAGRINMSWDYLREICKVLHVDSNYLFFGDDSTKKEISSADAIRHAEYMVAHVNKFNPKKDYK
ncbi:MAG: helix-turn-helix transcriptional regulator [Defluviitaleaceae bacterium]|nr:helix-turn-helix transcriptional regulator [Defluviitaleaceae bacterium]